MAIKNSMDAQRAMKEQLLSLETLKAFFGAELFAQVVHMSRGAKELAEFLVAMHRVRIEAGTEEIKAFTFALVIVNNAAVDGRIDSETALALVNKVISWFGYYG